MTAYSPDLSDFAGRLGQNPIRKIMVQVMNTPGCISLGGGRPVFETFSPSVQALGPALSNYGIANSGGEPGLRAWVKKLMQKLHDPQGGWEGRDVWLTSGNTDGMNKAVMLLSNPGDVVVTDKFTYPGILTACRAHDRHTVGVEMDDKGMIPERLEDVLKGNLPGKPRMIYVVTHGQNPTGCTMDPERVRKIYEIARAHNLAILEDDPYCFMDLEGDNPSAQSADDMPGMVSLHSFLSIDEDRRVVRLDSVSKFIAPGFRVGWVTAHTAVVEKWSVASEVVTWGLSGFQHTELMKLFEELGEDGLHKHLQFLQFEYRQRRDRLVQAFNEKLSGVGEWNVPRYGMFLWFRGQDLEDAEPIAEKLVAENLVAMIPGSGFAAEPSVSPYFRVSFTSIATTEIATQAAERLLAGLSIAGSR
mmetsp:Transcript_33560/g.81125  ORF Transcript_33560/g.81125 Transcript_33560/m.81125 type:complete len:417 (+) Transcript_33560:14-1264(+)